MEKLILFSIIFVIIYSFYMIYFIIRRKSKKKILEVYYLENKYKLDLSDYNMNKVKRHIAFINSFIFTITLFLMSLVDSMALRMLIAFATVMFLILVIYKLLAIVYKNKKWNMKYIILIIIIFSFTGCTKETIENRTYKSYINELKENNNLSDDDGPFDLNIYYDKLIDDEVMYRVILDDPTSILNDVEILVIHDYETEDIFPSSGIFDTKYSLKPDTIDMKNNYTKGIILVGYIDYDGDIEDLNINFKVLIKYNDEHGNQVKYYYNVN